MNYYYDISEVFIIEFSFNDKYAFLQNPIHISEMGQDVKKN